MGFLDNFLEKQLLPRLQPHITKSVVEELVPIVDSSISKANGGASPYMTGLNGMGAKRYSFTPDMINGGIQRKGKPGSNVPFETLRNFAISHEVTRACINLRKRQITGLEWNIVTAEDDDTGSYDAQIAEVKAFFKNIGGRGIGYRRFMNKFIEDLMVLDAVAIEKQRTRGGGLFNMIPIDGSTIRLRVDDSGATPEPPEVAYTQVIRGQVTAEWTDDEMIYEMMNPRTDTPYGLAPLESLIVTVMSALQSSVYNLNFLTDTNVPAGFFTLPDTWQPQQIKDFQEYFDALMAGDMARVNRLKFMPQGTYTPTVKPNDMAFKEFNDWLMKLTCALFEVTPMSIGFMPEHGLGGKGLAEEQGNISDEKGLMPLALFIEEIFTRIIQEEFGYDFLKFDFPELRQKDAKSTAELNAILLNSGQRTIDELRTDDGLDPLPDGLGARPFILGTISYLEDQATADAKAQASQAASEALAQGVTQETPAEPQPTDTVKTDAEKVDNILSLRKQQVDELRVFRKYAINKVKDGRKVRPFVSKILPLDTVEQLNAIVSTAKTAEAVREAFDAPIKDIELLAVDNALEARNRILSLV